MPTVLYRVFHDIFTFFLNFRCCTTTRRHERLRVRPRKIKKGIQVVGVREIIHFMRVCVCVGGVCAFRADPRVSLAFYIWHKRREIWPSSTESSPLLVSITFIPVMSRFYVFMDRFKFYRRRPWWCRDFISRLIWLWPTYPAYIIKRAQQKPEQLRKHKNKYG